MNIVPPILLATALLIGCSGSDNNEPIDDGSGTDTGGDAGGTGGNLFSPTNSDLTLNTAMYQEDGYASANVIRVDIQTQTTPGICTEEDQSGCTLDDVLADVDSTDELTVDIPVHFQSDDFPDDGTFTNATLRLRGGGSRQAPQKSFRIKLDSKEVLWRNERFMQVNKHPFESTRIRNKLAFDLMSQVPHLPSMRTQFVNLWIDDGEGPVDYGLYTHVERPNDDYLERHGLDNKGNLYKAEDFQFDMTDLLDVAVDEEGEPLDEARFESSLEIEEGDDHRALVAMLAALHDPERSFESVLAQYFNENNVISWMAANILLQQADATRHNYLLYNPEGSEKFYFLPWDYDAALNEWQEPPNAFDADALRRRLEYGYAVGAMNDFTAAYLRLPGIHERLLEAVSYIHQNYITDELALEKATHYASLVTPYESRQPDSGHNPHYQESAALQFSQYLGLNEDAQKNSFSIPMPPTLSPPVLNEGQWEFQWAPAYDVTGHELDYDLQISSSLNFAAEDIVLELFDIPDSADSVSQNVDASQLPAGDYYVRLIARSKIEADRFWQVASNKIVLDDGVHYGVLAFSVP